jgi:DNA-binding NtrC family response regulator
VSGSEPRHVFGGRVDLDLCVDIARRGKGGRRGTAGATILIDAAEQIPVDIQPHLARAIEDGMLAGGPRILALVGYDPSAGPPGPPPLSSELWYALSALTVRMPRLDEREGQRAAIARALVPVLAARMNIEPPHLDGSAVKAIERAAWPGNLRQMRTVLCAVLAAHRDDRPVSRAEIEAQLDRASFATSAIGRDTEARLRPLFDHLLDEGGFSLSDLERSAYQAAVDRARGNLSAAARLLGLTRAQLAYRSAGATIRPDLGPQGMAWRHKLRSVVATKQSIDI